MKLPSIAKLPRNKRFDFAPRLYDPVKEEIDAREASIRQELIAEKKIKAEEGSNYERPDRISFHHNARVKSDRKTTFRQIMIGLILCAIFYYILVY